MWMEMVPMMRANNPKQSLERKIAWAKWLLRVCGVLIAAMETKLPLVVFKSLILKVMVCRSLFSGTLIFSPVRGLGSGPNFNLDLPGQPFSKPNNKYQSRKQVSSTDWMYKTSERKGLVSTRVRRKSIDMTIVTIQPGSTGQSEILIKTNFREVNGGSLVILIKMELRTKMSHFWLNGSKMGIFQKSL